MNLWVFGTGESLLAYRKEISKADFKNGKVLAFHKFLPLGYKYFGVIPDYFVWGDPFAAFPGLEFLDSLEGSEKKKFSKLKLVVPHFMMDNYSYFRMYCGTTPCKGDHWIRYKSLLNSLKQKGFKIEVVDSTTTKYIESNPHSEPRLHRKNWLDRDAALRFDLAEEKCVFGTVKYDSEFVIGHKNKWGLENKVSGTIFPIAHWLGAKNLFIAGFDFQGGRFYDYDEEYLNSDVHQIPQIDEHGRERKLIPGQHAAATDEGKRFALSCVDKWVAWKDNHNMSIHSLVSHEYGLLSITNASFITFKEAQEIK
jgi:hypothetical protein